MFAGKTGLLLMSLFVGACQLGFCGGTMLGRVEESQASGDADCSDCQGRRRRTTERTLGEQEIRNLQIDIIKMKILRGLNLAAPPALNSSDRGRLPAPLRRAMFHSRPGYQGDDPLAGRARHSGQKDEDAKSTIEKIAIYAETGSQQQWTTVPRTKSFRFGLNEELSSYSVRRASLWLYISPSRGVLNQSTTLYVSDTHGRHQWTSEIAGIPGLILAKDRIRATGWIDFDVSEAVSRALQHGNRRLRFSVSTLGQGALPVLDTGEYTPFVVIRPTKKVKRTRRSADQCRSNGGCCREPLEINVREIGWDYWIKEPRTFNPFYCRGTCSIENGLNPYPTGLRRYLDHHPQVNAEIAPCCAAVRLSSITLLVRGEHNTFVRTDVPNMKVDACECR